MKYEPFEEIIVDPDAKSFSQRFRQMLSQYEKTLKKIQAAMDAWDTGEISADFVRLSRYTEKFSGQLQYLRLNLGRLRAGFMDAFAPIGSLVLPVINRCINRLNSFLHSIQAVFAALADTITGTDSATKSAHKAAKAYKSFGTAARRSLAGFDQITRLNAGSGGSESAVYDPLKPITQGMQQAADKLLQLLAPLLEIDLTPLKTAAAGLWEQVKPLLQQLGSALQWLWLQVLTPFMAWCAEKLLPALMDTFGGGFSAAGSAAKGLMEGLQLLWEALQPAVRFIEGAVLVTLRAWQRVFQSLSQVFAEKGPEIATIFHNIGQVFQRIWAIIGPILTALYGQFQDTFAGMGAVASQVLGAILEGLAGISEFVAGVFIGNWQRAWDGILYSFKGMVNSLIGLLNMMLTRLTASLNGVIRLANSVSFRVPDWVPGLGGETFGFSFKTLTAPQIPYLAQGAVLPANRPFLAMVGDQRHGTNIEAPLATIQQAVATVLEDYTAANMAGHRATVGVLEEILEAVLGIEIGDAVVAAAVQRHQDKMAIVKGAVL